MINNICVRNIVIKYLHSLYHFILYTKYFNTCDLDSKFLRKLIKNIHHKRIIVNHESFENNKGRFYRYGFRMIISGFKKKANRELERFK